MKPGTKVLCNGYQGVIKDEDAPKGMCIVKLERGEVCVDLSTIKELAEIERAAVATGTANQQERYAAGVLPEAELLQLARVQLFQQFPFPRWNSGHDREKLVRHFLRRLDNALHRDCPAMPADVEIETGEVGSLNAEEWAMFKKFTLAASLTNHHEWLDAAACSIEPSRHTIACKLCKATSYRISVKVSIAWAGRTLVREYLLDPSRLADYEGVPA